MCPSGMAWVLGGGPVHCVYVGAYVIDRDVSEQVRGFRSMHQNQRLNCCQASKGLGGEGWGWGTGLVCRSWGCQEAEGADALMQPWRAELGSTGNLQGGRCVSARVPPWNEQPWEAASDLSRAKPSRANKQRIPFLGRHFMTNDLWGQDFLYLCVSW